MSALDDVISVLEGEARRVIWLPPFALGYVYTITGVWYQFGLAILALGGARIFSDLVDWVESEEYVDNGSFVKQYWNKVDQYPRGKKWLSGLLSAAYFFTIFYSIVLLIQEFRHQDPILVGLLGIYGGLAVIVLLNISSPDPSSQA